jgi:hypothetical protein
MPEGDMSWHRCRLLIVLKRIMCNGWTLTNSDGWLRFNNTHLIGSFAKILEFARSRVRMGILMPRIPPDTESGMSFSDEMLYAAFRAAFVVTLDCMLRESLDRHHLAAKTSGFLDVYPVLKGTAPQIQLECLLSTWEHLQQTGSGLSSFDNCVINAAYEALAMMGELTTRPSLSNVWKGPVVMVTAADHWVASKVRAVQLLTDEKSARELAHMEAELADERDVPGSSTGSCSQKTVDDMISIVGRWTASAAIVLGSKKLLTEDEQDLLRVFFEEQTGLLR